MGIRLPSGAFTRNIYKHKDDVAAVRKRYKNKGVYVSAYKYTNARDKANSLLYGDLYIDLDIDDLKDKALAKEAFEKIREDAIKVVAFFSAIMFIDEAMIKIYYSGQKGLHIIVPAKILGIAPHNELNHHFKMVAKDIHTLSRHKTVDTQIYDNARLFSLPGGMHPETGRYKIPLTYQELRTLSFSEVKKLSREPRRIKYKRPVFNMRAANAYKAYVDKWEKEKIDRDKKDKKGYKKKLSFCPPCIESILNRPCPNGFRNNTSAILSNYFKQRGFSKDKGWKLLKNWNTEFAKLPENELSTTFESIYNGEYEYGCSTLEMFGDCNRKKCKIGTAVDKKKKREVVITHAT